MSKGKMRLFSGLLAALLLIPVFSVNAFAMGNDPDPLPAETTSPTVPSGEPLTEDSDIVTRDLLYDKATNKQFVTVQDREGNFFYLVIDYDAPVGEDEEQFKTYFLNPVDASDLAALAKEEQHEPPVCSCTEKCGPGHIDMNCPVCATNMTECLGKEPTPPTTDLEPSAPVETKPEEKPAGNPVALLGVLALVAGGGALAFLKLKKGKEQPALPNPDDYDDYTEDDAPWEVEGEDEPSEESEEQAQ